MRITKNRSASSLFFVALTTLIFAGCTHSSSSNIMDSKYSAPPRVAELPLAQALDSSMVPRGTMSLISGPLNSQLNVMNSGKTGDSFYFEVEGALSPASFTRLKAQGGVKALSDVLSKSLENLKKVGIIPIKSVPEVGYFTFWVPYHSDLMGELKSVSLPAEIYMNPRHYDVAGMKNIKAYTAASQGFTPRAGTSNMSGLTLMHAPEFVKLAEPSLNGAKLDGSSVKVGIADTGITYNHPTFLASDLKTNRIIYMKDFTKEGRVYFNPKAKFSAVLTDATKNIFTVQAEYNETQVLPRLPDPSTLKPVTDLQITVSDELKAILQNPKKTVSLSYLNEATFQGGENPVDLNANGKLDDQIPMLLVIDQDTNAAQVYADFTATNDFTNAVGLGDFTTTHATAKVFAERIGFHIQDDQLVIQGDPTGATAPVKSASIVGYDSGPHGTHVAGIAAGRKTISNDSDNTLARGVAPAASILSDRICANNGGCNEVDAIIDLTINGGAEVINLSIGGLSPFNDGYGAAETIVNRLTSIYNVLFMISAGNDGPSRQTVSSPSNARLALSIGAAASRSLIQSQYQWPGTGSFNPSSPESDEFMLYFSSRGPTAAGGFKPNISAPGTELSSIQLNAALGTRAGLDVYWGTSMAAPSATGAYALLLDAVKKYNSVNTLAPMPSDAQTLRSILIQSARPFAQDQYTWMDQGTGMIDLVAAWNLLLAAKQETLSSGVKTASGQEVALDYEIMTSIVNPTGQSYTGDRAVQIDAAGDAVPAFGTGIYLSATGTASRYGVYISRNLPEAAAASSEAGDLTVALETSQEEFVLKTDFGHDDPWIKAGVLNEPNCMDSDTANLRLIGNGTNIAITDNKASLNPFYAGGALFVCVDRAKLATMPAGDHGALIYAYRTDGTNISKIPAFVVPVSITLPHKTLVDSTAYDVTGTVKSFQVAKNYVSIPKGATLVRVTLEVPAYKAGQKCSEVMLQSREGNNMATPKEGDAALIVNNCSSNGAPANTTSVVLNRTNPLGGIWDLAVFGMYTYAESQYHLRVDYLMAGTSVASITGDLSKLSGSFDWNLGNSSITTAPDVAQSSYKLTGLYHRENSSVATGTKVVVGGPLGVLRSYPAGASSVTIDTGGAPGDDIDLDVFECATADGKGCAAIAQSGSPTDVEHVNFAPKAGKFYAVRVAGYNVIDEGNFFCDERISFSNPDSGDLAISANGSSDQVQYSFSADEIKNSTLLNHPLFTSKQYQVTGSVVLRSSDNLVLGNVPVTIGN